jgi:hypothetical protein
MKNKNKLVSLSIDDCLNSDMQVMFVDFSNKVVQTAYMKEDNRWLFEKLIDKASSNDAIKSIITTKEFVNHYEHIPMPTGVDRKISPARRMGLARKTRKVPITKHSVDDKTSSSTPQGDLPVVKTVSSPLTPRNGVSALSHTQDADPRKSEEKFLVPGFYIMLDAIDDKWLRLADGGFEFNALCDEYAPLPVRRLCTMFKKRGGYYIQNGNQRLAVYDQRFSVSAEYVENVIAWVANHSRSEELNGDLWASVGKLGSE